MNYANSFHMDGGKITSSEFGLVINKGKGTSSSGYVSGYNSALLVRNGGAGDFTSTTFEAKGNVFSIYNEAGASNLVIRSRSSNYGITGKTQALRFLATTNPGQASENITLFYAGVQNVLFAAWSSNGGQDDVTWTRCTPNASGNHTFTLRKSDHKNDTGEYIVDLYEANSSWAATNGIGRIWLNF